MVPVAHSGYKEIFMWSFNGVFRAVLCNTLSNHHYFQIFHIVETSSGSKDNLYNIPLHIILLLISKIHVFIFPQSWKIVRLKSDLFSVKLKNFKTELQIAIHYSPAPMYPVRHISSFSKYLSLKVNAQLVSQFIKCYQYLFSLKITCKSP